MIFSLWLLVAGCRGRQKVLEGGDIDDGIWTAGMVIGLINDIPSCQALLDRMMSEAQAIIQRRLTGFYR
ncbi:Nitronate monooxygenase [Zhongshania aliphaticivorans]|uniref:Nitronate monooxygenase n=1 Tax=Zhongshania aliphaticivorans TaxID=1470434 RepID=A0A5S9P290_9GAMM|nr:hypothetical protein [Zhongshania aliphaticivorans]CAA0090080.1 Nitronate monooxygenase [Zhongshania aliphaticivorans]CAA0097362.1 Nitronate monooxygenase [Zhongshania aliphaticivorans]